MKLAQTSAETARLARDLSGLLELGYPLLEALGKLTETCDGALRDRLQTLIEEVRTGTSVGEALIRQPGPFPLAFAQSFRQAELGHDLPQALRLTAQALEETSERMTACTLASLYPAVVATFLTFMLWIMIAYLSSEFDVATNSLQAQPSALSLAYSQLGAALRHPIGIFTIILGLTAVWKFFTGNSSWRYRLPIYGPWLANSQAVLFLRWSHHLIRLGTSLPQAVRLAADVDSSPLAPVYHKVAQRVERGDSLSQALDGVKVFPSMGVWLIAQEQARESMDLHSVADFLSCELDTTQARGTAAIEPVTLLIVGLAMLFTFLATQGAMSGVIDGLG